MPEVEELTVSGAARELSVELGYTVRPRDISKLFYDRVLPDVQCPIVAGRRLIRRGCLPMIADALRGRGPSRGPEDRT